MPNMVFSVVHPSGSPISVLDSESISRLTISNEEDNWARMSFVISTRYDLFSSESNASNPVQINSLIYLYRGSQYLFRGYIHDITRNDVRCELTVNCISTAARINGALALIDGNNIGGKTAPVVALSAVALYRVTSTSGYASQNEWHYYPTFEDHTTHDATKSWVGRTNSRSTTITADVVDASTTITIADGSFFTAPCFVSIGTGANAELIYCDNLYRDSASAWKLSIAERGCCGGVAMTDHASGATIWQRRVKPFNLDAEYNMDRFPSNTVVPAAYYRIRASEGRVDFTEDPTSWSNLSLDYSMFDIDDDVNGITLATAITDILTGAAASLGPGLTAGEVDTTGLAVTLIPAINLPEVTYAMDYIRKLIDESWSYGLTASKRIVIDYDPDAQDVVVKSVTQGTSSNRFGHATEITQTLSLDRLYSAALVSYVSSQSSPLLSGARCWHPARGDDPATAPNTGSVTDNWDAIMFQDLERAEAAGWQADTSTTSNNVYTARMFDGDDSTGWGIRCLKPYWAAADPRIYAVFAWFPNATALTITYARLVADCRNYVMGLQYLIELVGFDSYTPGTPPTLGNVVPLGVGTSINNIPHPLQIPSEAQGGVERRWIIKTPGSGA